MKTAAKALPQLIALAAGGAVLAELLRTRGAPALSLAHLAGMATSLAWFGLAVASMMGAVRGRAAARLAQLPRPVWIAGVLLYAGGLGGPPLDKWVWCAFLFGQILLQVRQPRPVAVVLPVLAALSLGGLEAMLAVLRSTPALAAIGPVKGLARRLYLSDWSVIQLKPECATEDARLIYRLRPGVCSFSNTEFHTTVEVNSAGLRDSEQSLKAPEVIVLGDSFAMGWGVEGSESFAELLEQQTGRQVLNAAISSYGTARELLLLRELDLSRASDIIVQYCGNDYAENLRFAQNGNQLPADGLASYQQLARAGQAKHYRFPQYAYLGYSQWIAPPLAGALHSAGWPPPGADFRPRTGGYHPAAGGTAAAREEAELFVATLANSADVLEGRRLLLCRTDGPDDPSHAEFFAAVEEALASSQLRERPAAVRTVDLQPALTDADHFRLDPHLNVDGHAKVARLLAAELRRMGETNGDSADIAPQPE